MANQLLQIINQRSLILINAKKPFNKHKPKIKPELNNDKSNLPPHLRSFKQKLLTGNGFIKYN